MRAIHQFIPTFATGDAIGGHARQVQRFVRELGLASEIYCQASSGAARGVARPYRSYDTRSSQEGTLLLYQLSIGSPVANFFQRCAGRKLVNYHNVTPARLIHPWEPQVGVELDTGRHQLALLADDTELGIAVSAFNEAEMVRAGYRSTTVAPVMMDLEAFDRSVDEAALTTLQHAKAAGGTDWLFVGRVAPNKCQHDVVKAFAAYRRMYEPTARLHLVGASSSHSYWTTLERYVAALGLDGAVFLTGPVPTGVLAAHFRSADVFVCLSEHEGFCVPLLEAMHHRLPIVAYDAAAVPETLSDAGVLLRDKDPGTVAAAVNRVLSDSSLRHGLLEAGDRRLGDFSLERTRRRWMQVLEAVLR